MTDLTVFFLLGIAGGLGLSWVWTAVGQLLTDLTRGTIR